MAIETILLAIGSNDQGHEETLADAVIEVAGPTGARVVLAHVFEEDEFDELREALAEGGGDIIEQRFTASFARRAREEHLADMTVDDMVDRLASVRAIEELLDAADVSFDVRGVVGADRGESIADLASELGADRVVIGGRRRSPAGKAVFGSTAQEVLLSAPCPVTFVRRD